MKIFESVADAKAAKNKPGQKIETKGYYFPGDGGAATYLVKTAAEYGGTPDGYGDHYDAAGNVLVLQHNGIVNVKQFGAKGDGIADDTQPWLAFEAYNGNKEILSGDYLVLGVVKSYGTATVFSTNPSNYSIGNYSLESNKDGTGNMAVGINALKNTNGTPPVGSANTAVGVDTLASNTKGYRSTAVGYQSCYSNQGDLLFGNSLTALGYQTLYNNTEGKDNTALGYMSMFFNTGGGGNTAVGYRALYSNTGTTDGAPNYAAVDGSFNTCVGYEAMLENTTGKSNTAIGWRSLQNNTIGVRNTVVGQEAAKLNTAGSQITAVGYKALSSSTAGSNTAFGYEAGTANTSGTLNTFIGESAAKTNTTGTSNTAVGYNSLSSNSTGSLNTAVGRDALKSATAGNNSALGHNAGGALTTAVNCTALGVNSLSGNTTYSNCTGVGANTVVTAANQVQLGDSTTTTYAYGAVQDRSDARDKIDIKDLTDAHIAFFMDVEWKQFRMNHRERYVEYDEDGNKIELENDGSRAGKRYHIGAIAQQVEAAMKKHGIDFAGLQHHKISGGEDVYTIGYQEFIGLQGEIIKRQQRKLERIEQALKKAGIDVK